MSELSRVFVAALFGSLLALGGCASKAPQAQPLGHAPTDPGSSARSSGPRISAPESVAEAGDDRSVAAPRERVRATSISPGLHAIRTSQPLRQRPQVDGKILRTVTAGTPVQVVQIMNSQLGHWAYIETDKDSGWVAIEAFGSSR